MADTQRTKAQLLALFADNVTGQITAQNLRDFLVTIMDLEVLYPGDFFQKPQAKFTLTDKTGRGQMMYSQVLGSDCSFGNVMCMDRSTGYWVRANCAVSTLNGFLALAMDSYTSNTSTATMMVEGVMYDSSFSTVFSRLIGRPIYLASGVPGSITITAPTSAIVIGTILQSDAFGNSAIGKYYFRCESWAVRGV